MTLPIHCIRRVIPREKRKRSWNEAYKGIYKLTTVRVSASNSDAAGEENVFLSRCWPGDLDRVVDLKRSRELQIVVLYLSQGRRSRGGSGG